MCDPAAENGIALMHAMSILTLIGCFQLAVCWRELQSGQQRTDAVLVSAVIGGLVGRMSKTALLSLCTNFNLHAKNAISVGVSVSGLVPVMVGVLQYAPKKSDDEKFKHFERFGVTESMYYIASWAALSYAALLFVHKGRLARGSRSSSLSRAGSQHKAHTSNAVQFASTDDQEAEEEGAAVKRGWMRRGVFGYEFHSAMLWPLANLMGGAALNCSVMPGMLPFLAHDFKV
jgi:hypothetical protein